MLFSMAVCTFADDGTATNESEAVQREKLHQRVLKEMREAISSDGTATNDSEAVQREKLYQFLLKKSRELASTNKVVSSLTNSLDTPGGREAFNRMIYIHPSFGFSWDSVPAPTMTGSNAMAVVDAFIATNGWDMQKDGYVFSVFARDKSKPISGLPWKVIYDRQFPAVTYNGILYVCLAAFHDDSIGVAYNPKTNTFAKAFNFKPIGQHWYVWAETEQFSETPQEYEGATKK